MPKRRRKGKKVSASEKPWLKFWPEGVPQSIDYPEVPLFHFLEKSAEAYPDNTAIIFFGREITYQDLNNAADRFANALHNMGIEKGDVVALYLPNVPQFVISYYGAMKAGATLTLSLIHISEPTRPY